MEKKKRSGRLEEWIAEDSRKGYLLYDTSNVCRILEGQSAIRSGHED